jgi:hypothetical protein
MNKSDSLEAQFDLNKTEEATETQQEKPEGETEKQPETAGAVYLGSRKFQSVDELVKYTEELERRRAAETQQATTAENKRKRAADLIYEDPAKAFEIHEQEIIEKIKGEEAAKRAEKELWDSFYAKNKDLSEDKDLVEFALNRNWNELRTLHPDQAMEKLADYTRKTANRFRKAPTQKQEMPSGQAKTGPGTSYSAPQITEKKPAAIDFVTQLKKIQSKRK